LNTSSLTLPFLQQTVTNGSLYTNINAPNGLLFPLKVSISLLLNTLLITSAAADVSSDIEQLKLTIAEALTTKYTNTQIRISDADIILLAKAISYVDDANVTFTDSSTIPVNIANNEINVKPINSIIQTMSKADRISYNPVLWHWDINNIVITYTVE